jgi:hypothetical protein
MGSFEEWVLHLGLILHLNLQYLDLYLPLPNGILGFCCNTYTRIYLYQLEFWGFIAIPTHVLAYTNWNFGASLQYLHMYLPLPIGILGLHCNTYTYTYLYQLEFWGFIAIPTHVLAYTNWIFGVSLQYLHMYLPLPIGILGLHCNTYTCTYLYQLEFWGFIAIPTPVLTFTNWNFGASLQYLHMYLLIPIGILGLHCNTYTCTYLYQLEFWGFIAIPTHVLTFTNWNFGASLQYLHSYLPLPTGILGLHCNTYTCTYLYHLEFWSLIAILAFNTNIITIIVFLHFTFFVLITWKQ